MIKINFDLRYTFAYSIYTTINWMLIRCSIACLIRRYNINLHLLLHINVYVLQTYIYIYLYIEVTREYNQVKIN